MEPVAFFAFGLVPFDVYESSNYAHQKTIGPEPGGIVTRRTNKPICLAMHDGNSVIYNVLSSVFAYCHGNSNTKHGF